MGVVAGACVGVGVAMWCAPRAASELRQRIARSLADARHRATERYQDVSTVVGDVVEELGRTGQHMVDVAAESVTRGAREVERQAERVASPLVNDVRTRVGL